MRFIYAAIVAISFSLFGAGASLAQSTQIEVLDACATGTPAACQAAVVTFLASVKGTPAYKSSISELATALAGQSQGGSTASAINAAAGIRQAEAEAVASGLFTADEVTQVASLAGTIEQGGGFETASTVPVVDTPADTGGGATPQAGSPN